MAISDGRVVSNFIVQALTGEDITIYGSGNQTRSFCYVDDLISGMIKLMASDDSVTGPVNIGNPNEFTMNDLATAVLSLTNSKSKIVYLDLPADDPQQRKPDITVANRILGWTPSTQLNDGLAETIGYFKSVL
jgi:UDP-glucuronate decarboxylase